MHPKARSKSLKPTNQVFGRTRRYSTLSCKHRFFQFEVSKLECSSLGGGRKGDLASVCNPHALVHGNLLVFDKIYLGEHSGLVVSLSYPDSGTRAAHNVMSTSIDVESRSS